MTTKRHTLKVLIIGAGPAGCTAAYELAKNKNIKIKLIEISKQIGGMARSIELFGSVVDIGPHRFFSNDLRVNKLWLEIVGNKYKMVNRITRIYYKGKYFSYPLKPLDALSKLGIAETIRCIGSFVIRKINPVASNNSFQNWVINRFGDRLFNIFFKSYTEKLWGISCNKLSAEFAVQRIKKFSLWEALKYSFNIGGQQHKTLVDQFAYPLSGNGFVYSEMISKYTQCGGDLCLNKGIAKIAVGSDGDVTAVFDDGTIETFDQLISTMPIDNFLQIFSNSDQGVLENTLHLNFRNTIIVYIKINKENIFPDQWLYVQDDNIQCGRITNFNNWVPEIRNSQPGTILAMEYWCYKDDSIWSESKDELFFRASQDLVKTTFVKDISEIIEYDVIKINKCYPVYDDEYKTHLDLIKQFMARFPQIQLIGRYGSFKYNNQDHSILMGYLAARNIKNSESNDLWEINADYEYHEKSRITSTGLVSSE